MNAVLREIELRKPATLETLPGLYSRVGASIEQRCCPSCESIIYSRRHKLCGVCAAELPEEFLFDAKQAENVATLLREERLRHRVWLQRFNFTN
jgi:hypothetical protein